MSRTVALMVMALSSVSAMAVAKDPPAKPDPAAVAREILDARTPPGRRDSLLKDHAAIAPELVAAMTAGLQPGPEEYRRIGWIWRVAIAAGRRNDADQLRRLLDVALPKAGERLRDWQAVVVGGGLINGVSLEGKWPAERFGELLRSDAALRQRWDAGLADAHRMADDPAVPTGTRYDALRMIALDSWDRCRERLAGYLKKGTHAELQMGAVSGLSDIDRPEVAGMLADAVGHLPTENRKLAIDGLLRTDTRKAVLRERLASGGIDRALLTDAQRAAMGSK